MTICDEILAKLLASIFVSYDHNLLEMTTNAIRIFSISFVRTLVFQVIMILLLPSLFGINSVWFAVLVTEILALVVSSILLTKNKKKYQYA